jgi:hypothetical protein
VVLRARRLATGLVLACLATTLASGCAGSGEEPTPTSGPTSAASSPGSDPADASASGPTRTDQTLWRLLDAQGEVAEQLPDDDPDVVSIRSLVVRHSDLIDNRESGTVRESVEAELAAYTPEFARSLAGQDYSAKVVEMYGDNRLAVRLGELAWYPSTLSADRSTATFETTSSFVFTRGARSYLKARGLATERPYVERRRISLTRTSSGWRISAIDRQPLERG